MYDRNKICDIKCFLEFLEQIHFLLIKPDTIDITKISLYIKNIFRHSTLIKAAERK